MEFSENLKNAIKHELFFPGEMKPTLQKEQKTKNTMSLLSEKNTSATVNIDLLREP